MASPTVVSRNESTTSTAGTSHVVSLPGSLVVGNLIFIASAIGSTLATFNTLTGWTELLDEGVANGMAMWYRVVDGTEGSTVTFTSSASTRDASVSYQINQAENPAIRAPELSTVATGTSVNPNATAVTPTGGAKDYLWITTFAMAGEEADDDTWVTATPTNFTNTLQKTGGTVGTNLGGLIASAEFASNAASMDAAAWTVAVSAAWRAYTVAFHPAVAGSIPAGQVVMGPRIPT